MGLWRAERRRLAKRRSVTVLITTMAGLLVGIVVTFIVISHRPDAVSLHSAQQAAQADYQRQVETVARIRQECAAQAKLAGGQTTAGLPPDCAMLPVPARVDFQAQSYLPYEFDFARDFGGMIMLFAAILVLFVFIAGATYVGAEWHAGGMMTLLLWRPRRIPVLLTKLGTLLGATLAAGSALAAVWTVAFWLIGRYDGTLGRLTSGVWRSYALTGVRALVLGLVFAAVGFALASIGRHTALALGAAVAVTLISEIGVRIVLRTAGASFADRWSLSTYAAAWMEKRVTFQDWRHCQLSVSGCSPRELVVTWQQAGLLLAGVLAVAVGAAVWSMRRRDVT
jgi:ABC-2 type transport system permease protein